MNIAFRCDASIMIGTGHVMRCLTLAKALRDSGANCFFVCREHKGHLTEKIQQEGFECILLAQPSEMLDAHDPDGPPQAHAGWLGASWQSDTQETINASKAYKIDWLIVDHYALDARWHRILRPHVGQIMVIDDLADRPLDCDLLLDQNIGRDATDYDGLVPLNCKRLIGWHFVLLRPEFSLLHTASQARNRNHSVTKILVSMGGMDYRNNIVDVLKALGSFDLPANIRVLVVLSGRAPHLPALQRYIKTLSFPVELHIDTDNLAQIMCESDLAISASGLIVYELAYMGLPMILLPVSEIQRTIAARIKTISSASIIEDWLADPVPRIVAVLSEHFSHPSANSSTGGTLREYIDANGAKRVVQAILHKGST